MTNHDAGGQSGSVAGRDRKEGGGAQPDWPRETPHLAQQGTEETEFRVACCLAAEAITDTRSATVTRTSTHVGLRK